jgi:hypothetical protein
VELRRFEEITFLARRIAGVIPANPLCSNNSHSRKQCAAYRSQRPQIIIFGMWSILTGNEPRNPPCLDCTRVDRHRNASQPCTGTTLPVSVQGVFYWSLFNFRFPQCVSLTSLWLSPQHPLQSDEGREYECGNSDDCNCTINVTHRPIPITRRINGWLRRHGGDYATVES